jgi:hypothetical protein
MSRQRFAVARMAGWGEPTHLIHPPRRGHTRTHTHNTHGKGKKEPQKIQTRSKTRRIEIIIQTIIMAMSRKQMVPHTPQYFGNASRAVEELVPRLLVAEEAEEREQQLKHDFFV